MATGALGEWGEWIGARIGEFSASIHFLTRLPLRRHDAAAPSGTADAPGTAGAVGTAVASAGANLAQAAWAFPFAGFVVGLIGAIVYLVADRLVLFSWPAAALAVAATIIVTGALHEDGLADTADGFGAGATPESRLAIMRDSRIGTFGACALIVSIGLRWAALASLAGPLRVAAALIAAHVAARAMPPLLMRLIPPARPDGLSAAAGLPPADSVAVAALLGFAALLLALGTADGLIASALLVLAMLALRRLALNKIGGQTGDVLGALEQVSEVLVLLVAARG
jgi:adenosylcobinamide-GDP ribazoletransferase